MSKVLIENVSQSILHAAMVAHEANRAWCDVNGDDSQKSWNESPSWQLQCAVDGVLFHQENPHATDSASHENWMKQKIEEG